MSLDCGRKPEYPVKTHACTGRTCKLHAERPPGRESNPGPSCCKATVLPTATLCSPAVLKRKIASPHVGLIKEELAVPRIKCPSLESFNANHLLPLKPVILEGIIDHWPALNKHPWSIEYLRSVAGCRTVPVEVGSRYTDEDWSQTLLTVNEFIDKYILNKVQVSENGYKAVGYLAQHQLFDQ
ncbi:Lysine-specific demethylase 8, partial [Ilyodon furcidens]